MGIIGGLRLRVKEQLRLVERYFKEFVEFRRRGESIYAIERLAQLVIQSLLDLGAMIAVYKARRKPETYRGVVEFLASEVGLSERAEFLRGLAGFRKILVHGYAEMDRELEEEAFREMEEELPRVIEAVGDYLRSSELDPRGVKDLPNKLRGVFERSGVRFAFLFGSKARTGEGRDYDIAVSLDARSALELGRLLVEVAEALGVREDLVDLLHLDTASSSLIYTVLCEGILIYGDEEEAYGWLYRRYLELLDIWSSPRARKERR